MAKDVDLSSKEWRDLIFEGKNKDFGAYKLRQGSESRHNKAFFYVLIGLVAVCLLIFGYMKYEAYKTQKAEEEAKAKLEQQQKLAQMEVEKEEEKEEEVEQIEIEEVKPEAPQLATQLMTELLLTDTPKEDNEIKANEDIQKDNSVMSTFTQAGSDDINLIKEHKEEVVQEKPREEKKKEEVFTHVEQMPKFPGGDAELYKFISNNLNYPAMAIENNVQGRVVVQFVVTKDGSIGNVKVVRSVDRDLDNEAIRVCKKLPKFIPGKQNGQPVNVWYTLPVTFKLQN
jgi:protein TonB